MKKLLYLSLIAVFGFLLVSCDVAQASPLANQSSETSTTFTLNELSQYTGANGSTAYIAVDGVVYDVTNVFTNGTHQGIQLGGTDATAVFAMSPHNASLLATLPVVGSLNLNPSLTSSPTSETSTTLPVFTLSELSQYTGANGTTAYIAVNGVIYDVTNAFVNGMHQGIQLGGTDATSVFTSSPHTASLLATLSVVGSLEGSNPVTTNTNTTSSTSVSSTTESTLPVFTLTELSQYTGLNGTTAYIAVNGVVYDVTNVFTNGSHQGMQLGGTDATSVFASSPHSASLLATLTVVGSLEGYSTIPANQDTSSTTVQCTGHDDDDNDDNDNDSENDSDDDDSTEHNQQHEDGNEYDGFEGYDD